MSMNVIPVIDLMGGVVVHARRGERDRYRPIESKLCPSAEPAAIVQALVDLHPFRTVYVADLDAIRGLGDNGVHVAALRLRFPHVELWLDAGVRDRAGLARWADSPGITAVVGSETLTDTALLSHPGSRMVLSLDWKDGVFYGDPMLLQTPSSWPRQVLAMNLSRVGADLGPDLELIGKLKASRPDCEVYAAGGVRSGEDLRRLKSIGAAGALIATALHSGAIGSQELEAQ